MAMDTFMLRIMYIIYLTVMALPASSLCKECSSSMDDDKIYYDNDSVILPLESYCFVNECTIRIKESNVLLNVINITGDWIIATNTTNMCLQFVSMVVASAIVHQMTQGPMHTSFIQHCTLFNSFHALLV